MGIHDIPSIDRNSGIFYGENYADQRFVRVYKPTTIIL